MKTETRSFFSSSLTPKHDGFKLEKCSHHTSATNTPLIWLTAAPGGQAWDRAVSPYFSHLGWSFPSETLSPRSVMASAVTDIAERRQAKRISCPEPRGWGKGVGGPICIFSINELELSSLAWGDNLRGKSLHILFKSTLR